MYLYVSTYYIHTDIVVFVPIFIVRINHTCFVFVRVCACGHIHSMNQTYMHTRMLSFNCYYIFIYSYVCMCIIYT